jgi:hypothetical protein
MSAPTVIVSGMIAATPGHGGAAWAVLQYLLGLRRLGCEVYFVEPVEGPDLRRSDAAHYCAHVMERFGFGHRWALVPNDAGEPAGMPRAALRAAAREADVLLNISGMLTDADVLEQVPVRVFLDLDPVFVQLWHADGVDMRFDAHTNFVTVADAIGMPGSDIPACGRDWLSTLPPVVLEEWPFAGEVRYHAATTVGNWRSYGAIVRDGTQYGQKVHSLRTFADVPRRADASFALALGIHPDESSDLALLEENGWQLIDPAAVASTPDAYRHFIQGSWAEFGLAKSGYIVSGSGWFSDRSACYLASGRPVIAQDSGFGRRLPVGAGLLAFSNTDDVVAAVEELHGDYERHRAAAREVAEAHLDSDRVLGSLLERLCR